MKTMRIRTFFALVLIAGLVVSALSLPASASEEASHQRKGRLHLIKDTTDYDGLPGGHAVITFSNLAEIPVGSKLFYDQAPDIPKGLLDSNVVLDDGNGNRAVGRCTTDLTTWIGLCTFSDGIGTMAGFQARLNVSFKSGELFDLRGTYRFTRHNGQ